jgi:hypothetical protein
MATCKNYSWKIEINVLYFSCYRLVSCDYRLSPSFFDSSYLLSFFFPSHSCPSYVFRLNNDATAVCNYIFFYLSGPKPIALNMVCSPMQHHYYFVCLIFSASHSKITLRASCSDETFEAKNSRVCPFIVWSWVNDFAV